MLLVIYTFIQNIYKIMINIIISVKGLQKISDRLYIRVCIAKFITILYIAKFIITNDRYNTQQGLCYHSPYNFYATTDTIQGLCYPDTIQGLCYHSHRTGFMLQLIPYNTYQLLYLLRLICSNSRQQCSCLCN